MSEYFEQTNPNNPLGGRYKVIRELGAGGFGQTFLAEDLHLPGHPQCVVKKLKPQTSDTDTLAMARRLFDTEAQVLYQLGNHEQIPRLLAHFEDNQEFYLAQELIEGEPLTQELVSGQPWSEVRVIALVQDILQVLAFVHEQQVIHRDLKPPNLIRRYGDGKIVLIDFGAVKQVSTQNVNPETGETNLTISIGTKGYMPNEQLGGTPRFSSDVYAVGMLGIQALTGIHPTRLKEDAQTGEINWREHALVSPKLADVLDRMVCYDFRDRYPTAVEALEALQSLPATTDSLPLEQPLSEVTEATPNQDVPVPSSAIDSTESGVELDSTDIWVPTESPIESRTASNSLDPTEPLSQQERPQEQESLAPTKTKAGVFQRQLIKLWPILAALAAGGVTTFVVTKGLLFPQMASQTVSSKPVPSPSPTGTPVSKPTPPPRKPDAKELLSQGDHLRETGDYQKALSLYDQAIALNSKMAKAYWGRCYSLNKLHKPAEAIVACNDALDLKPDYAEALWSKGNAIDQQEKLNLDALHLYEQATEIKPNFAEAWVSLGVALQNFGRSVEAIDALDRAIALNRNSVEAWSTKGAALLNLGRFDEAIPCLDKALQIQPNNAEAVKLRQLARKEIGR